MGALFDCTTFPVKNTNLEEEFYAAVKNAQYEHGHGGYSGTLAEANRFVVKGMLFDNRSEAIDWIYDHHEKYKPCIAVKYKATDGSIYWVVGGWMPY